MHIIDRTETVVYIIIEYTIMGESSRKEKNLKNAELLSIGTVSRLSGVHIKSLRYYDRLGILRPAYTDPDTGYRYYTFPQLSVIDAIKMCVELDIPLKNFTNFIDEDGRRIRYAELFNYGRQIAEEKQRRIEEGLAFIDEAQKEISRTAAYLGKSETMECVLPEREWFIDGCKEPKGREDYARQLTKLMLEAEKQGFSIGYELGIFHLYRGGEKKAYLFVDVQGGCPTECENFFRVPESTYLCRQTSRGSIEQSKEAFLEIGWENYTGIVVETELFTGEFDFEQPVYELQCLKNRMDYPFCRR